MRTSAQHEWVILQSTAHRWVFGRQWSQLIFKRGSYDVYAVEQCSLLLNHQFPLGQELDQQCNAGGRNDKDSDFRCPPFTQPVERA